MRGCTYLRLGREPKLLELLLPFVPANPKAYCESMTAFCLAVRSGRSQSLKVGFASTPPQLTRTAFIVTCAVRFGNDLPAQVPRTKSANPP